MDDALSLPARFDSAAAKSCAEALLALRGRPVTIDARAVIHAGALAVQALIAGRRQWLADGAGFRLTAASAGLLDCCRILGVDPTEIGADPGTGAMS